MTHEERGPRLQQRPRPQRKLDRAIKAHEMSKNKIVAAVGITFVGTQYIVQGRSCPRVGVAQKFCDVLGLDWEDVWTYKRPAESEAS